MSASSPPSSRRLDDPEVLKGLAQPIRQRLYRLLIQIGPATVGTLAKRMSADPGLVSYHLRELARRGFIEDVPELARDRRERWWRAIPGSGNWSSLDFTSPEGQAIAAMVKGQMVADEFARLRRYEQSRDTWSEQWRRAATSSDSFLRLTPDELAQLTAELGAVLARWAEHGRTAEPVGRAVAEPAGRAVAEPAESSVVGEGEEREHVFLFFHTFPERP